MACTPRMNRLAIALFFAALSAFQTSGYAQNIAQNSPPSVKATCLGPAQVDTHHLHGLWQVRLYDGPLPDDSRTPVSRTPTQEGTLLFERHPEHADSLRGTLKLKDGPGTLWLSGDLDEGELILDESDDGRRITAVWVAYPTAAGCGRELRGNRRMADDDRLQTLVLTRSASWN